MRKTSLLSIILMLSGGLSGLLGAYALQGGPHSVTFPDAKTDTQLRGHLYRPEGPGPFPAVVFLHGCVGIRPKHHWWAQRLRRWGYVVLIVDSFGPRNITNICVDVHSDDEAQRDDETQGVHPYLRTFDAHGGLRYLQRQPYIEAHRSWPHGLVTRRGHGAHGTA